MDKTHGDILDPKLDLPEALLRVVLEVGKRDLEDSALQRVVGVLCPGYQSLPACIELRGQGEITHSNPAIG